MINFGPKAKVSKKAAKKPHKTAGGKSTRTRKVDDGFTPEDIAEINMFGAAFDRLNWEASKRRWADIVQKAKSNPKANPRA